MSGMSEMTAEKDFKTSEMSKMSAGRSFFNEIQHVLVRYSLVPRENWWYGTYTTKMCGTKQYFSLVLFS
jgi:hypothetical protein